MTIQNVKLIVFDLDGTIADTAPDIRANVNETLNKWGLSPYTLDEVKGFVGNGAKVFAQRVLLGRATELKSLGISNNAQDLDLLERFYADHMSFYKTNDNANTVLYDGVYHFLESSNVPLALYTNKPGVPTERLLDHFAIGKFFFKVLHADNVARHKPDPVGLEEIMREADVSPDQTLMVGDGMPDIVVAKAVGCRSVALLQGNTKETELRSLNPDWVVPTFADFLALL